MFRRNNVIKEAAATTAVDRRNLLKAGMFASLGLAAAPALAACGGGSSGSGPALKWAGWDGPPQSEVFRRFSEKMTGKLGVKVTYQQVVGDYLSKLLSQLSAGAAPDAFYVGDIYMAKLIETKQLLDLTDYLDSGHAAVKLDDFHEGLYQWCRPADGSPGLYGLPVDCSPLVFWFNKDLLAEAGVSTDPAAQFEAGTWTQDALTDLLDKIRATKKKGLLIGSGNWFDWFGWMSTFGGTLFDDSGKAVFDTDPKSQDSAGVAVRAAEVGKHRLLAAPSRRDRAVTCCSTPASWPRLPSAASSCRTQEAQVRLRHRPLALLVRQGRHAGTGQHGGAVGQRQFQEPGQGCWSSSATIVNAEGQKFRLSGGGNAVPSINGLDDIVTEGNLPAHGKLFNDVAAKGYAVPARSLAAPKVTTEFPRWWTRCSSRATRRPSRSAAKVVKPDQRGP